MENLFYTMKSVLKENYNKHVSIIFKDGGQINEVKIIGVNGNVARGIEINQHGEQIDPVNMAIDRIQVIIELTQPKEKGGKNE